MLSNGHFRAKVEKLSKIRQFEYAIISNLIEIDSQTAYS